MKEIGSTKSIFDEANELILKHIEDVSVVDEKLESGTKQILELQDWRNEAFQEESYTSGI